MCPIVPKIKPECKTEVNKVQKTICAEVGMYRGYVVENWPVFLGLGRENRLICSTGRLNTKAIRTATQYFLYFEVFVDADLFPHAAIPVSIYCYSFRGTLISTRVKVELIETCQE